MKRISKHGVNKLTASELKDCLPFQMTNDGEVIAVVISSSDKAKYDGIQYVNKLEAKPKGSQYVNKLRFSKEAQASGRM